MPPKTSLVSSFSITDSTNEVWCPLRNQDGTACSKRCTGDKRYRSMQEHIRRAHPAHYIPKLPATEASFQIMVNTPPSEKPRTAQSPGPSPHQAKSYMHDNNSYRPDNSSAPVTPRNLTDDYPPSSSYLPPVNAAAAALTQLSSHSQEPDLGEPVGPDSYKGWHSDTEQGRRPRSPVQLPPIHLTNPDITSDPFPGLNNHNRQRDLLPSIVATSPPGRSSTLPPFERQPGPSRPKKQSVARRGREAYHKRQQSRGSANDFILQRLQRDNPGDRFRPGGHMKALSAEPSAEAAARRWDYLISAATSATEDISEGGTPVPQSPISVQRASLPPLPQQGFPSSYHASPLQQALTPPSYAQDLHQEAPEPFPSVESADSGGMFNMDPRGLSDSSPSYGTSQGVQIYCAACGNASLLRTSYACTECICGLCQKCVEVLINEHSSKRKCPRCQTVGGRYKPFQLDIR